MTAISSDVLEKLALPSMASRSELEAALKRGHESFRELEAELQELSRRLDELGEED